MALEKPDNISTATTASIVLDLLLLNLVQQVQRLVEETSVRAAEVRALKQANLHRLHVIVLVQQHVQLADCLCAPHKLLLDEVGVLRVQRQDFCHEAGGDDGDDTLPMDRVLIE